VTRNNVMVRQLVVFILSLVIWIRASRAFGTVKHPAK
jgi:hypothetical protein